MSDSKRYAKIVEWSNVDNCYIGSAPGLIYGGCHGDDEQAVFAELCEIVEEVVQLHRDDGRELPPPTIGLIDRLDEEDAGAVNVCGAVAAATKVAAE